MSNDMRIPAFSADEITFTVRDRAGVLLDFSVGVWKSRIIITSYADDDNPPLTEWLSDTGDITLEPEGVVVLHLDPTEEYTWTHAHFDAYVIGPEADSKPIRIDHGSAVVDF